MPFSALRAWLLLYFTYARLRHRNAPSTFMSIDEFIARRTPLDQRASAHRLSLIATADFRSQVCQTQLPVFHITGVLDPLVPALPVRRWLKRHCPGYRCGITLPRSDHNVLGTAPVVAADTILNWIANSGDARKDV
jgi:pimeloyl-ACP methyl ester carboxylesterase